MTLHRFALFVLIFLNRRDPGVRGIDGKEGRKEESPPSEPEPEQNSRLFAARKLTWTTSMLSIGQLRSVDREEHAGDDYSGVLGPYDEHQLARTVPPGAG